MSKSSVVNISLNVAVFIFALIGVIATSFGVSALMVGTSILYYTVQSNIWIGLTSLTFAILQMANAKNRDLRIPDWLYVVKYVFVVAITLTMVVFWLLLAPTIRVPSYFISPSNIFAHTLTPIASIVSFLAFDSQKHKLEKKSSLFSLATPLYYMFFAIICSLFGVTFSIFKMPYFFVDFYEFGWFSSSTYSDLYTFSTFGVFYWILIVIFFVFSLGSGLLSLNRFVYDKRQKVLSIMHDNII